MVILQRRLERIPLATRRTTSGRLLRGNDISVVSHEAIGFLGMLLAAPDSEGDQKEGAEDSSTANADNDTNDGVASLNRHAGGLRGIGVEGRRLRGLCRGSMSSLGAIGVGHNNYFNLGRNKGSLLRVSTLVISAIGRLVVAALLTAGRGASRGRRGGWSRGGS